MSIGCAGAGEDVLRLAIPGAPPHDPAAELRAYLDPAQFGGVYESIADPLVVLDEELQPTPALAESWDVDGRDVVFHLRSGITWTNGDPVTAADFEFSWKRILSPEERFPTAYLFRGIEGAAEYAGCEKSCGGLRKRVAVRAVDDSTLAVRLTSPQPWFVQLVSQLPFAPVHPPTVRRWGDAWADPDHLVTNGPFRLSEWDREIGFTLVKWDGWRDAEAVALDRVEVGLYRTEQDAVAAYEAGELDAIGSSDFSLADRPDLRESDEYVVYPLLSTFFAQLNTTKIRDPAQRKAMAIAIDRRRVSAAAAAEAVPATSFIPDGMPHRDRISSGFLTPAARLAEARALMREARSPLRKITLWHSGDGPAASEVATGWRALGLDVEVKDGRFPLLGTLLGPPPSGRLDAYVATWIADFPDPANFFDVMTCGSPFNSTGLCAPPYDSLLTNAIRAASDAARVEAYRRLEAMLTGPNGNHALIPLTWGRSGWLESDRVRDGFEIDAFGQFDLRRVTVDGS